MRSEPGAFPTWPSVLTVGSRLSGCQTTIDLRQEPRQLGHILDDDKLPHAAHLGDLVVATDPAGDRGRAVTGVAYDSRLVRPGAAFVALKGLKADGLDFVPEAVARGAGVVVKRRVPWTT